MSYRTPVAMKMGSKDAKTKARIAIRQAEGMPGYQQKTGSKTAGATNAARVPREIFESAGGTKQAA